jgi:hypothetical protein
MDSLGFVDDRVRTATTLAMEMLRNENTPAECNQTVFEIAAATEKLSPL